MTVEEAIAQIEANMVSIPGGTFLMGSPSSEPQRYYYEGPQQRITVTEFEMSQFTVSFSQWCAIMDDHFHDDEGWGRGDRPVINVSWDDAQEFIKRLNFLSGNNYRLPSESEWEYAARAGTTTRFNTGDCITTDQANFDGRYPAEGCSEGESRGRTMPVGSFEPNGFGLYDMHGNVWEWMEDRWNDTLSGIPLDGTARLDGDVFRRVLRGGSWSSLGWNLRSAARIYYGCFFRNLYTGFRLARSKA